jgi:hypothetical protein
MVEFLLLLVVPVLLVPEFYLLSRNPAGVV